jgi:hypothetical protein
MSENTKIYKDVVFVCAYKKEEEKDAKYLLKLNFPESDRDGDWCLTSAKVFNFADNSFEKDEICEVKVNEEEGKQKYVVLITKTAQKETQSNKSSQPSNTDKGSEVDSKQTSIEKQNVVKATAKSLEALAGQVSIDNICEVAQKLLKVYDDYYKQG